MRKNIYLNHLKFFAFLVLSTAFTPCLNAAHLIGGEVTYKCLGYTNNDASTNSRNYEFTINVYRDCQSGGSEFDSPTFQVNMHITVYQGNNQFGVYFLDGPTVTTVDVTSGNPCIIVPSNICVEGGAYVFELDLPIVDEEYQIVYQRCCRNNTITNILNPESSGSTYTITVSQEAQTSCNNSPVFREYPPGILCVDQNFNYDFSATDEDGDLLVYEFCNPFLGGAMMNVAPSPDLPPPYQNVVFLAPNYTANVPLGASAELELDPITGLMTGHPDFTGQFVVGVCVSEYRNGILLSTVRRDFQFNVTTCQVTLFADLQEDSTSINNEYIVSSCGDTEITLRNESGEANFITGYEWIFDINGQEVITTDRDFSYNFPDVGSYFGKMIVNPGSSSCTDSLDVLVNIFPDLDSEFSYAYDTCIANPVAFTDLSTTAGGQQIINHIWQFGDGNNENELSSPDHLYEMPGTFNAQLQIIDENGCSDISTQPISYFPVPDLIVIAPSSFEGCAPADIFFDNLSTPINDDYFFDWDFGDGGFGEDLSPTHTYETPGVYSVALEIISPIGCQTDTVFNDLIDIFPAPIAGFMLDTSAVSGFNPSVNITDQSSGTHRWFYNVNGESTTIQPSFEYVFQDTGLAFITQTVTHILGCQDTITKYVDVVPPVTFYFPNAFTPNGDGVNDAFKGVGFIRGAKSYQMMVWNRWGEPIFHTTDPLEGWNGRKNNIGRDQHTGVYLYEAQLVGPRGELFNYKGFATLIR